MRRDSAVSNTILDTTSHAKYRPREADLPEGLAKPCGKLSAARIPKLLGAVAQHVDIEFLRYVVLEENQFRSRRVLRHFPGLPSLHGLTLRPAYGFPQLEIPFHYESGVEKSDAQEDLKEEKDQTCGEVGDRHFSDEEEKKHDHSESA